MKVSKELKEMICQHLNTILEEKAKTLTKAVVSIKESRDNDTKSSAGDKYETGRAMMQIELEKCEVQLRKSQNIQKELSNIDFNKEYMQVDFGSLIETNHGIYFFAVGIGKIEIKDRNYFCISLISPIGNLLKGKRTGEKATFQQREYVIKAIV